MTPTPEEMPAFAAAIIVDSRNSDMSDRGIIKLFLEILTPDGLAGSPSLESNAWAASAAAVVFTTFLLPFGVPPPAASKSRHGGGVDKYFAVDAVATMASKISLAHFFPRSVVNGRNRWNRSLVPVECDPIAFNSLMSISCKLSSICSPCESPTNVSDNIMLTMW